MTAEVAVLNKTGVAIAADSAVTTGYPGSEKIFTSANKIFMLSKTQPVGIMINGHVEHFGLPWEVIIKSFRSKLKTTYYSELQNYVDAFLAFASEDRFINEDGQTASVLVSTLATYGELHRRMSLAKNDWTRAEVRETLEEMLAYAEKREVVPALTKESITRFNREYADTIEGVLSGEEDLIDERVPKACWSIFKRVTWTAIQRRLPSQFSTGLVFVGYGADDLYPKLIEVQVDGGIFNKVRTWNGTNYDMKTAKEGAVITAFAQDDVVNAYLKGADDRYIGFVSAMFMQFFSRLSEEFLKHHAPYAGDERKVVRSLLATRMNEAVSRLWEEFERFGREHFADPINEVLRTAPKETLVELAEALISITALRQRVSGELETVSGPVDVAVISKGDGFIWIKRKHYFKHELNHHFLRNYFRELRDA
jgi:hypothetical protein